MRIEGKDYTKRSDDIMVIKLPKPEPSGAWGRFKRWLGVDDDGFEVSVLPPTKGLYDRLGELAESLAAIGESDLGNGDPEAENPSFDLGRAVETVAAIMSRNAEKRVITPQMLEDMGFDIEDVGDFVGSYVFFINELVRAKN